VTTLLTRSPEQTRRVGAAIASALEPGDVVLLAGPLGAGKTQLAKGIAEGLGVEETVVSPTFTIAREYEGRGEPRMRMLHVDVYRLDQAQEVLDLGLEDLAISATGESPAGEVDAVTVVEWGDAVEGLLPSEQLLVRLELGGHDEPDTSSDNVRVLRFEPLGPTWSRRFAALTAALESLNAGS
jgi:tRNA threonylcarbamoyladenosine biosynthesis protein TsaE